uniref:Uncharacterized protein n=1 Tax=Euplotes harpa TaxID=151035 RepID=A0A7S3J3M2_9SPIT|mmetsp:Transcript_17841/g.20605  ORF Transcript_17841/g.20605 Transcript_17841/m.20605 type:complete len:128 (+) Transcript_17841:460-843(+)
MTDRETKFIAKKNLKMKVLPEFKELFDNAPGLSRSRGRFNNLVKNVEQRRERQQTSKNSIEETKEITSTLKKKDQEIQRLLTEIDAFKDKIASQDENAEILARLYDSGVIDEKGLPKINSQDQEEMS